MKDFYKTIEFLKNYFDIPFVKALIKSGYTWWLILTNHKKVFNRTFEKKWEGIAKPIPFLLIMTTIYYATIAFGPSYTEATWFEAIVELNEPDIIKLAEILSVPLDRKTVIKESLSPGSSKASELIRDKIGSVKAEIVADYLIKNDYPELAYKFIKAKNKVSVQYGYIFKISAFLTPFLLLIQIKIIYMLFTCNERTYSDTLNVLMYVVGFATPLSGFLAVGAWEVWQNWLYVKYAYLSFGIFMLFKIYNIFHYTHQTTMLRVIFGGLFVIIVTSILSVAMMFLGMWIVEDILELY